MFFVWFACLGLQPLPRLPALTPPKARAQLFSSFFSSNPCNLGLAGLLLLNTNLCRNLPPSKKKEEEEKLKNKMGPTKPNAGKCKTCHKLKVILQPQVARRSCACLIIKLWTIQSYLLLCVNLYALVKNLQSGFLPFLFSPLHPASCAKIKGGPEEHTMRTKLPV